MFNVKIKNEYDKKIKKGVDGIQLSKFILLNYEKIFYNAINTTIKRAIDFFPIALIFLTIQSLINKKKKRKN